MKKDWMIKESELDDDQLNVLMGTLQKSCIVEGCAGSGKSVLALIKAQRIQKEYGNSYQIIVYTKALCHYMNSGRKELGLNNDFSYHKEWKWKRELKHYGGKGAFWVYLKDENGNYIPNMPSSDYVIVDEIQDFTEDEIREFIQATNKHFFFFGDTAQSIFEGLKDTLSIDEIGYLLPKGEKPKPFSLYRNYRLPLAVARLVQYIGVGLPVFDEKVYKSKEKSIPYILKYPTLEDQITAIKKIVKKDLTDVAILAPNGEMVKKIGNALKEIGINAELRYNDKEDWRNSVDTLNFSTTNPKVMTYHSAKGLQFETVFLPNMEFFGGDVDDKRKALYVAATRTYKNLYIMYSGELPSPLSEIPESMYKTTEIETLDDF